MARKVQFRIRSLIADYSTALNIVIIYSAILLVIAIIFYPLIPFILNYPEGTVGGQFQRELENANYFHQYLLITFVVIISVSIFIFYKMRGIEKWKDILGKNDIESMHRLEKIQRNCMTLPYTVYIAQVIIPSLLIVVVHAFTTKTLLSITTLKIWIVFFSFLTIAAVITHIFSRRILTKILLMISSPTRLTEKRIDLKRKIFIQMIPMFIVALLFTSLLGYSRLIKEKGDLIFKIYSHQMDILLGNGDEINSRAEIVNILRGIELEANDDIRFIISPQGDVMDIENNLLLLSPFFMKYMNEMAEDHGGRIYDYYGFDTQGVARRIVVGGQEWIIGVKYILAAQDTMKFFLITFIILLFLCCFILYYFSKSLADDISVVAESLKEIADGGDIDLDKKLIITSNDEIGDLVLAFNKIQEREKENIRSIEEKQTMLMEQERLASLGQLIGGIAHNLKTPIMSISGGMEALKDLITEYDQSIDDPNVNSSDHHEIASEMHEWLKKIKPHCSYMSDIISTVKGQAVQLSNSTTSSFTIGELVKRVDILMKHELRRYHCKINLDSRVDMNTEIMGELNNLVQIIDNIIVNAIQSYGEESGVIDFRIISKDKNIIFSFQDYGCGIPNDIQHKLFKEMLTTKGKNGTGLGLYMSYSTIKGRFGGNMWFDSTFGEGTTFYISIPCNSEYGRYQEVME